jgi:hypothetical protein
MKTQQYDSAMNAVARAFEDLRDKWEESSFRNDKGELLKGNAQITRHFLQMIVKMDRWWTQLLDNKTFNYITRSLDNRASVEEDNDDDEDGDGLPDNVKEDLETLENAAAVFESTMMWLVQLKPLLDTLNSNKKDKGAKLVEILSQGAPEI